MLAAVRRERFDVAERFDGDAELAGRGRFAPTQLGLFAAPARLGLRALRELLAQAGELSQAPKTLGHR
ncbi:MAG: hypothetical protein OHK0044_24650 [Burkholderiaceae bacterium]